MTTAEKNLALFGLPFTAQFEPTEAELAALAARPADAPLPALRTEELRVRHLKVGRFEEAARLLDAGDEVGFTAVAVGQSRAWVESLTPESYDQLAGLVQSVNQSGFFASMARRVGRRAMNAAVAASADAALNRELAGRSPSSSGSPT